MFNEHNSKQFAFTQHLLKDAESGGAFEVLEFTAPGIRPEIAFFLHGNNRGSGAWANIDVGVMLSNAGIPTLIPSQPGYGHSAGHSDFCGPHTVSSVANAIQYFKTLKQASVGNTCLWGVSRGAIVGALLAVNHPGLIDRYVLQSGVYDMSDAMASLPEKSKIKKRFEAEAGLSVSAMDERSAIGKVQNIRDVITLIHTVDDEVAPYSQAVLFVDKARSLGKAVSLISIPSGGHQLKNYSELFTKYVDPFLKQKVSASP